jgi:hypothetical protein
MEHCVRAGLSRAAGVAESRAKFVKKFGTQRYNDRLNDANLQSNDLATSLHCQGVTEHVESLEFWKFWVSDRYVFLRFPGTIHALRRLMELRGGRRDRAGLDGRGATR